MAGVNTRTQGRRGYYLYEYGPHLWFPETQADWSGGMFRDVGRNDIPGNGVYDSLDFLLHRPGMAFKRGGSSYPGPAMTGAAYAQAVAYARFPSIGNKLLTLGENGHLFNVTSGTTTDVGSGFPATVEKPKLFIGGTQNVLVFPASSGVDIPWYYDGVNPPQAFQGNSAQLLLTITGTPTGGTFKLTYTTGLAPHQTSVTTGTLAFNASATTVQTALNALSNKGSGFTVTGGPLPGSTVTITRPLDNTAVQGGSPWPLNLASVSLTGGSSPKASLTANSSTGVPTGIYAESHLSRIVLANQTGNENRIWFSPALTITAAAWDPAGYIDFPKPVSGLASIGDVLLVFSQEGTSKLVGDTPPPGSNMTILAVGNVGCTDARSIVVLEGQAIFANPRGAYMTGGVGFTALMQDRIESYWQGLFGSYDPTTWTISAGLWGRRFLILTVLDASRNLVTGLLCDIPRRAWVRLSEPVATMYASGYGASEELYAASGATNRALALSGFFAPTASNKNDAGGTAVTGTLETRPFGGGPNMTAFGKAHMTYDMRDAASDNPTLAVSVAPGLEATTYAAVAESPLAKTTDATRTRYATGKRSQAVSVKFVQSNASSKTEIYAVEQDTRGFPRDTGGQ